MSTMTDPQTNPSRTRPAALRVIGEALSQLLNVPLLSGALVTLAFARMPVDMPNRQVGFWWTLLFVSLIPLSSLLFYIPGRSKEWSQVVRRQRIASFVLMMISYPIGFIVLRLLGVPGIYEAIALSYTLITLGLIVLNLIFRHRASGHAAGVAGPVAATLYSYGLAALPLATLIPLVVFARITAKGHRFWELVTGSVMSAVITVVVLALYGFEPLSRFR